MDSGKVRLIKLTRCFRVLVFRFPVSTFRFQPSGFFYAGCGASAGSGLMRGL